MKILLVEDDRFFRKFYVEKLKESGFEVDEADDGIQGVEKIRIFKPDLVVLDIIMPNKDGFEVLKEVRSDPVFKTLPILVFSTLGQESDVTKARQLGASDFVNKSLFDFNELLAKIKVLVQNRQQPTAAN